MWKLMKGKHSFICTTLIECLIGKFDNWQTFGDWHGGKDVQNEGNEKYNNYLLQGNQKVVCKSKKKKS